MKYGEIYAANPSKLPKRRPKNAPRNLRIWYYPPPSSPDFCWPFKIPKGHQPQIRMINREEQLARIKQQIAKAVSEIEHGDVSSAVLALVDAFKIREELYEADYERQQMPMPIVVGPGEGDHPRGSEVKEAGSARIKVTKR